MILYSDIQGIKGVDKLLKHKNTAHLHKGRSKKYQLRWALFQHCAFVLEVVAADQLKILRCPRERVCCRLLDPPPVAERFSMIIHGKVVQVAGLLAYSLLGARGVSCFCT